MTTCSARVHAMAPSCRGFTLLELALVLLIASILLSGLALPLGAHIAQRRDEEATRRLDEAREALLGFAAAHARLPCPASEAGGHEAFAPGGDASNGRCADFHGGYLPGATLGLGDLDPEGYARDPWSSRGNRIRYAVAGNTVGAIRHALTRANGMQLATLPALGAEGHYLFICASGTGASSSGCASAAQQLTRRAALVLLSTGPNGAAAPRAGTDEARNQDGDAVFIFRAPAEGSGEVFDDRVRWVPIHLLVSRMVTAGRLP
jgi:prepilin-type N-terminal cleavage/methylation domain-containing protein